MSEIEKIAKQIIAKGRGILAADESTGTMTKRLSSVNIESTAENRLKFRETLISSEEIWNQLQRQSVQHFQVWRPLSLLRYAPF